MKSDVTFHFSLWSVAVACGYGPWLAELVSLRAEALAVGCGCAQGIFVDMSFER